MYSILQTIFKPLNRLQKNHIALMHFTLKSPNPVSFIIQMLIPVIFLATSSGCDKFEGTQTVPAYLQIDSVGFTTDYSTQGTGDQNFSDIWVFVDDDLIGGFEMPATIPVLAEGPHKLEIRPGIKLNGISETRAPYPCIKPLIYDSFEFLADSVVKAYGTTSYWENAVFVWMEDFEDASLAIHETTASDTNISRTQPAGSSQAYIDEDSQYSGISYLDTGRDFLELVSDDGNGQGFVFDRGDYVFMELHYKTDVKVLVGFYILTMDNTVEDRAFLVINNTDEWKKIYINFTPIVNETVDAVNFKVYFQAFLDPGDDSAMVLLDNIKLVTRPNL
jgi:hypothetical protein